MDISKKDELFKQILKWVLANKTTSIKAIQKHFSLGFAKTENLVSELVEMKILKVPNHFEVVKSIEDFPELKGIKDFEKKPLSKEQLGKLEADLKLLCGEE